MASPTRRDVHVNRPLTNVSIAYSNTMYIAEMVFPTIPVDNQSDVYFTFDKSSWFRNRSGPRAPGTRAPRADYGIATASYICISDALAKPIPDEVRDNADSPLRPEVTATRFVTDGLMLGLEKRVADLVSGSGNWAAASNPSTRWDVDTSDAWGDIDTVVDAVVQRIGRHPNTMCMSWSVWKALRNHPDLLDRVKYTRQNGRVMAEDLAAWFGVDNVYIGEAIYDSAQEGATESLTYVWGDMLWAGYVSPNAAIEEPSAGYCFRWGQRSISRFYEAQEHQTIIEGEHYTDEVITASDAGALMSDCTGGA